MNYMKASHSKLAAGILAVGLYLNGSVMAASIVGGISFIGGYTANNPNDLTTSTLITFANNVKSINTSGDFSFIADGTPVTTPQFLTINDAVIPQNEPIWSVAGFSLTLDTLVETSNSVNTLALYGTGNIQGPAGFDDTPGEWVATFNSSGGVTFSFSASSSPTPGRVPDGSSTIALLGMSLLGMEGIRRKLTSRKS